MSEKNEEPISCKTILVGDSAVGKTSIIARYLDKYKGKENPTIGASFANKIENIDGKEIKFEIWDTAGQERFRSINSIFYQDAYICIMVYDVTNQNSFQSLGNYWYNAVKEYGNEEIIYHVAGNKIDLFENEQVEKEKVKEYCESINAEYCFVSASENTYIGEMFKNLGKKFINSDLYKKIIETKSKQTKTSPKKLSKEEVNDKPENKKKKRFC
jgi:small GTP-binding protein